MVGEEIGARGPLIMVPHYRNMLILHL